MGMNLRSACHRCREQVFHFRGEEQKTLIPFYKRHEKCMEINPNYVETLEDELQEKDWMRPSRYFYPEINKELNEKENVSV